ncbi:MAG: DUF5009 domain-containing protein [Kiritimatiellae bacterium]|nr:DUF5009 domain-containing protein [Kiritimatiellia bacterium]
MSTGKSERLWSLDALRGADMLFIMGGSTLISALCALFGSPRGWLATQMNHVQWAGFAHHDTIFPLFLFIAGAAWPFSLAAQQEQRRTKLQIMLRVFKRMVFLFLLGLVYNGLFKLDFAHLRIPSVLNRIGFAWGAAALLTLFIRRVSVRAVITALLLVGSWALLRFVPPPGVNAPFVPFTYGANLFDWLDRLLLSGHIIGKGDPEGILSQIPAIGTAMLGVFSGELLRSGRFTAAKKALLLAVGGIALAAAGFLWQPWCPSIKKLWTPTFVLFAGAYSALALALFYWLCDVMMWRKWTFFFRVIGMNAIAVYLLQRAVDCDKISRFFFSGLAGHCNKPGADAVIAAGHIAVCWCVLYFLYRKQTFMKV